nr:formin-like protein 16 [Aegilops tauschii subsp. strangulata]
MARHSHALICSGAHPLPDLSFSINMRRRSLPPYCLTAAAPFCHAAARSLRLHPLRPILPRRRSLPSASPAPPLDPPAAVPFCPGTAAPFCPAAAPSPPPSWPAAPSPATVAPPSVSPARPGHPVTAPAQAARAWPRSGRPIPAPARAAPCPATLGPARPRPCPARGKPSPAPALRRLLRTSIGHDCAPPRAGPPPL